MGGGLGAHRAEGRAVGGHRGAVGGLPAPTWSLVRPSRSRMCVVTMRSVSSRRRGYGPSWGQGGQEWAGGGRGAALPAQRGAMGGDGGGGTLLVHCLTVLMSSWITRSTHLRHGSFSFTTCFFTMASNARSGVNSPVLGAKGGQRVSGRPTSEPPTSPPSSPHPQPPPRSHVPDAVDVLDGVADLPPQVLLVELHLSGHHSAPISAR